MSFQFEVIAVQGHRSWCQSKAHVQFLLKIIVTLDLSPTVFEILTHLARKQLIFQHHPPCMTHPSGWTPCDINAIYTLLKSTFNRLQSAGDNTGSIFIRLAVVGSLICEMPRNFKRMRTYSRSRLSKGTDLGVNRKSICDFLLVIYSNFGQ